MTHELKTWPEYFSAVFAGLKTFEIRRNDRHPSYAVGDTLCLKEFDPVSETYSGRQISVLVTYEISSGPFSIPGMIVMAIAR